MATWRVNNSTAIGGEVCSQWQANHSYATGARCVCTGGYATVAARGVVFECTDDGTSHATTQPTWDYTVGNTTSDGTVTWTARSPSDGNWNNASAFLFYVLNHTAIAAGDTVLVDEGHDEGSIALATAMTIKGSSTASNPIKIICVDSADDSLSTGAIFGTGAQRPSFTGFGYCYGCCCVNQYDYISFTASEAALWIMEGGGTTVIDLSRSSSTDKLAIGNNAEAEMALVIKNGNIRLELAAFFIEMSYAASFEWIGGTLIAPAGSVTNLFYPATNGSVAKITVRDVDLSAVGAGSLVAVGDEVIYDALFMRCKLSANTDIVTGTWQGPGLGSVKLRHCSDGNRTYDFYEERYEGVIVDETTIIRTGGASDGTTGISCKMVSSAGCVDNIIALESIPIIGWTSSTTEKTFTIEFVHDSATALQNDEIWMELEYPANNTDGLGAIAKSKCVILDAPADTTDSTATWTTSGMANPNTRKMSVTVTPGKAGPICAKVFLAKASTTAYIDPMITES